MSRYGARTLCTRQGTPSPTERLRQIIAGKRSVSADTALRFGHWFGVEAQFWLNLQTQFDLAVAVAVAVAVAEENIGAELQDLPTAAIPA